MTAIDRINYLNIGLILLSCALAYWLPYHLLVFSYAVLGPAHYLTQISWLYDRKYFAVGTYVAPVLALLTILLMFALGSAFSFLLLVALFLALSVVLPVPSWARWALLAVGLMAAALGSRFTPVVLFVGLMLPTVIHVFVFTACFMLVGALKDRSISSYAALAVLLICGATFLYPPAGEYIATEMSDHPGVLFFQEVAEYLRQAFGLPQESRGMARVFGFLSFAYTYHYLNWFSKTRIIPWHRIPKKRAWAIVALYLAALGIYAYDYEIGLAVFLYLSLLHVVLEFPLNWRALGMIGGHAGRIFRRPPSRA